jgi:hypothetical protein
LVGENFQFRLLESGFEIKSELKLECGELESKLELEFSILFFGGNSGVKLYGLTDN